MVNRCLVRDLDLSVDHKEYSRYIRLWEVAIEDAPLAPGENKNNFRTLFYNIKEYYLEYYGDKETFADFNTKFNTYAVILPDGSWHSQGVMGWFGVSSETADGFKDWCKNYKARFIDTADSDTYITIVDCHI